MKPVDTALICGNRHQDGYISSIDNLLDLLQKAGIKLLVERPFLEYLRLSGLPLPDAVPCDPSDPRPEVAISIGGDGTLLRTLRRIGRRQTPVLGINTGHLGFLANYEITEARELCEMLRQGTGEIEERMLLKVDADEIPPEIFPYAVNEVAILKDDTASMLDVKVRVDSHFLADYRADGLLFSTATGSTGYNLSASGPILEPSLRCLCITPVAPHTLTLRPIVISADAAIEAVTESRAGSYRVSLDGFSFRMPVGSRVVVSPADFTVKTIRRPDDNFPATLRRKLLWGAG